MNSQERVGMSNFNLEEVVKRAVKYLIEGVAVAAVSWIVPKKKPS